MDDENGSHEEDIGADEDGSMEELELCAEDGEDDHHLAGSPAPDDLQPEACPEDEADDRLSDHGLPDDLLPESSPEFSVATVGPSQGSTAPVRLLVPLLATSNAKITAIVLF